MSQFSIKLAVIDKNKMTGQFIVAVLLLLQLSLTCASSNQLPQKPPGTVITTVKVWPISAPMLRPIISVMVMRHLTRICRSLNVPVLITLKPISDKPRNVLNRRSGLRKTINLSEPITIVRLPCKKNDSLTQLKSRLIFSKSKLSNCKRSDHVRSPGTGIFT